MKLEAVNQVCPPRGGIGAENAPGVTGQDGDPVPSPGHNSRPRSTAKCCRVLGCRQLEALRRGRDEARECPDGECGQVTSSVPPSVPVRASVLTFVGSSLSFLLFPSSYLGTAGLLYLSFMYTLAFMS